MDSMAKPYKMFRPLYSPIESQSDVDSESNLLEKESFDEGGSKNRYREIHVVVPWILTAVFAIISLMLWLRPSPHGPRGSYADGFDTDFDSILPELKLKQVRFTGALREAPNKTLISVEPIRYSAVGRPNTDLDVAWDELTHGIDLWATAVEAPHIGDGKMHQFADTGVYKMGIEWLHSLHCLNYIRKSFDYDYYTRDLHHPMIGHHSHVDHCIDALRQTIQCHGDATVMPKYVDEATGAEYTDFHQVHTCRDFDALREWANGRGYDVLAESKKQTTDIRPKE